MPEPARTQRYEGLFPSQTQEMFEADARQAAAQGWYPLSETWSGAALFVVYEHDPERRMRPPQPASGGSWSATASARAAAQQDPAAPRPLSPTARAMLGVMLAVGVVGVIALAMVGFQSWDRPGALVARPVIPATPKPVHHGDGVWQVPDEIAAGTYRAADAHGCYWARLMGDSGEDRDVIATDSTDAPAVVTIGPKDYAFETLGCGMWTNRLARITKSRNRFGPGTYIVDTDVAPGVYRSSGTGTCSWARLSGFGGKPAEVVASEVADGRRQVTILASDAGFTSAGCGTWTRR